MKYLAYLNILFGDNHVQNPYEILSMKYLWPSTINTQNISFKFYYLTDLLGFFDLSSISIYNEAKTMDNKLFHKLIRQQRGKLNRIIDELHVGDSVFKTDTEILIGWKNHFAELLD
jgi:hypothetical protein